jgi:hypothetical protein
MTESRQPSKYFFLVDVESRLHGASYSCTCTEGKRHGDGFHTRDPIDPPSCVHILWVITYFNPGEAVDHLVLPPAAGVVQIHASTAPPVTPACSRALQLDTAPPAAIPARAAPHPTASANPVVGGVASPYLLYNYESTVVFRATFAVYSPLHGKWSIVKGDNQLVFYVWF